MEIPQPRAPEASDAANDVAEEKAIGASRPLRSFVLRQGRLSGAQARHLAETLPRVEIPYGPQVADLDRAFGRRAPRIVEIGFGMGMTTAEIALARPEIDFIGIEVHLPGVGSLCKLIDTQGIGNLRIVRHDAVEVLRDMIAPGSLAGVNIYFPDPWPKKRHHKRRLIQPPFVALIASRLAPGGILHCATDWEDYALQMREVLGAEAALENLAGGGDGFAPRPASRPLTKFENRGLGLGHGVWDLLYRRR